MSRTFKTDPMWVRVARDGVIEHDHRRGECVVQDTIRHPGRPASRHRDKCPQRVEVEWTCCGECLACGGYEIPGRVFTRIVRDTSIPCAVCDAPRPTCTPAPAPDDRKVWREYVHGPGGVPRWFLRHMTHAPNRSERRRAAVLARKEYNAGVRPLNLDDDHDDDAELAWEPRQVRNRGAWWYWW